MKDHVRLIHFLIPVFAVLGSAALLDASEADQDLNLVVGWNAVWLEVEPRIASGDDAGLPKAPGDVFTDTNIVTVITPRELAGLGEIFGDDPTDIGTLNQEGWRQWHQPAAIGDDLVSVQGNRPYLIEVENAAVALTVRGRAEFFRPTWTPDRFNLVGFGIESGAAPSFQAFFEPSGDRHPVGRIFSLAADGDWDPVSPGATMQSGTAYWVYCAGNSSYMGPVAIGFEGAQSGQLNFGGATDAVDVGAAMVDLEELVFTNLSTSGAGVEPSVELITADPGPGDLFLNVVQPLPNSLERAMGVRVDTTPTGGDDATSLGELIAPETSGHLTLGATRSWNSGEVGRTNVYRLRSGAGTEFWLPVKAVRTDLQAPSDLLPENDATRVAGLWVGDVAVDAATSIVDAGAVRPVTASAPLRLLLHSDASGGVTLLSQVTLMQTKTADPSLVPPAPVLVLDPAKIPFYEGVRERQGKKVGVRIESVAFDMPRKLDAATQSALIGEHSLGNDGVADFLKGQTSRPPSLLEVYELSLGLDGALGAGKTARTASASPLHLDPFHRSNPFRHAFHQRHPRGPDITRTIEIVFDADQPVPDRLVGSYTERVSGLVKEPLEVAGKIILQRVSPISTLAQ